MPTASAGVVDGSCGPPPATTVVAGGGAIGVTGIGEKQHPASVADTAARDRARIGPDRTTRDAFVLARGGSCSRAASALTPASITREEVQRPQPYIARVETPQRRITPIVTAVLALLGIVVLVIACVALHHRARQAEFRAVCEGARVTDPIGSLEHDFLAIGESSSGHGWHGGSTSAPPDEHHWFRRTGMSRHQQCTVEVDRGTQRVVRVTHRAGTDFSDCRDPIAYPRRHWLCVIGDSLAL